MSRSSRRKTLSHSEIEDFLSEISVNVQECKPTDSALHKTEPVLAAASYVEEPILTKRFAEMNEITFIRELCKVCLLFWIKLYVLSSISFLFNAQIKFNAPIATKAHASERLCELGRFIHDRSNYPILPCRTMHPEQFEFPATSLEGKKKLLLSLSPMLSENENQRKLDIAACEEFTRCRSAKGKGRCASYEYTDLDTGCKVSFEEFERRYTLYRSGAGCAKRITLYVAPHTGI